MSRRDFAKMQDAEMDFCGAFGAVLAAERQDVCKVFPLLAIVGNKSERQGTSGKDPIQRCWMKPSLSSRAP